MSENTNETTAAAATTHVEFPADETLLLGVFADGETGRALLRGPDGQMQMVALGDDTPMGRLIALGESYVQVESGGRAIQLNVLGS